jgi:hypothetical protein
MTQSGTWVSYSGSARVTLAIILLVAAGGLVYAGIRLRRPVQLPRSSSTLTGYLLLAWGLAGVAFVGGLAVYADQEVREHIAKPTPPDPIAVWTLSAAAVLMLVVYVATPGRRWARASTAAIAAMAAAAIFELPFDLIVWARTYPAVPPDPALYRACFFGPLVLVELTTLSLLTVTPTATAKLSRPACCCLALMLTVFAVWALAGFGYPSAPFPYAMNVISKLLAFGTALGLFFPDGAATVRALRGRGLPEENPSADPQAGDYIRSHAPVAPGAAGR